MSRYIKPLLLCFLLFSQEYIYSQNLKKASVPSNPLNEVYELKNENIRIFIEKETGKYFIKTINNENIFYSDSTRSDFFTSHLNVKVNDSVYSNEATVARRCLTNALIPTVVISENHCLAEYKINNKITITQKLLPVQYYDGMGFVVIEITVKNDDIIPHDVGILLEFDLQIKKNDGNNLKTNTEVITNETLFTSNSIPFLWRAYDNFNSSNLIVQSFLKGELDVTNNSKDKLLVNITPPDIFVLGEWEKLFNVIWDYQPNENAPIADGAALMRWNDNSVSPNSEIIYYACIGETKGTIRDGKIISNSFTFDKIEYNGIIYQPDTVKLYTLVYNASDDVAENVYSSIELPYNLVSDNLIQKAVPENLEPNTKGLITYSVVPKLTGISKAEQITENIFSSVESFSVNYIIDIPAAPDADTLSPDIFFSRNNCFFTVTILENKTNDKGMDSIIIEGNNILYNIDFEKGDTVVTINGSLHKTDNSGSIKVMVFDRVGNYKEDSFSITPTLYGFDDEDVLVDRLIYLPFKKKSDSFDTLVFCKIKFDSTVLRLDQVPMVQQINYVDKVKLTILDQKADELSFSVYKEDGLPNGTLAFIKIFSLPSNNIVPTTVTIEELLVNDEPNTCTHSYLSNISFQGRDRSYPFISYQQFGCRFFFTIEENNINDKGIYYISLLEGNSNTTIIMDDLEPGTKKANIIIACTDSLHAATGYIFVVDGGTNATFYSYNISPALIKMDTVISKLKQAVTFTPTIYANFYDRTHYDYSFSVSYDTTVLTCIPPYFDLSGTTSINYDVNCDISNKGKVIVTASGNTPLVMGSIINLLFEVNTGKDTVSTVKFDYFYLKNGITAVHTTDGIIIRQTNDTVAPIISYVQKRSKINLVVTENEELDVGINTVTFVEATNFLINIDSVSTQKNIYSLIPIDSTKTSSCKVIAVDFADNSSSESIVINPIKIFIPEKIAIDSNCFTLPISIMSQEVFNLNSLSFKIEIDTQVLAFSDTLDFHSNFFKDIQFVYDNNSQYISFFINETLLYDMVPIELLDIILYTKPNLIRSEITILDLVINNDSLYAFCNKTVVVRDVDTIPPRIFISKNSCEYEVKISDEQGIDKIELKNINNVMDSIKFLVPFSKYDTVALFKIYPLNYKELSSFLISVSDLMGNVSLQEASLKPIKVSLPKDIIIDRPMNEIPILVDYNDVPINNISMVITYDERIISEYSHFTSVGTLLEGSDIKCEYVPPNMIRIRADNIQKNNLDTLLKLNVMSKGLDVLQGTMSIDSLSINNNAICSFWESALLHGYEIDVLNFSIAPWSSEQIGKDVTIQISFNSVGGLKDYIFTELKFYISFDPKVLKPVSVAPIEGTNIINEFKSDFSYDVSSGKLVITYTGNSRVVSRYTSFTAKVLLSNVDSTRVNLDLVSLSYVGDIKLAPSLVSGVFYARRFEWLEGLVVKEDHLYQNHPNPYKASTVIRFDIKDRSKTELTIYDITGRVVSKPVNNILEGGEYQINFDAHMLTSGVYFYQLKTERYSGIKKMVLIK